MRVLILGVATVAAHAQGFITTIAGTDWLFPQTPVPALSAPLGRVNGIGVDPNGNIFVADFSNNAVFRISPEGQLILVAGNGFPGYSGDGGPATRAAMLTPVPIALDSKGNLYIGHMNAVRKVDRAGVVTTYAGGPGTSFAPLGDGGPAKGARLRNPFSLAVDRNDNLYIADRSDKRIRRVSPNGVIDTVAGNGQSGQSSGDGGPATSATIADPSNIKIDAAGDLFILDGIRIRKVTGGSINTVASFSPATSLGFDSAGNLLIGTGRSIVRLGPGDTRTTIAGTGSQGYSGDGGTARAAEISIHDMAVDSSGNIVFSDVEANRVRRITPNNIITTIAGNGGFRFSADGVFASSANLRSPLTTAVDTIGNVYFSDTNRIRRITTSGRLETVAGNGLAGYSGDGGSATEARLNIDGFPFVSLAFDRGGNLYFTQPANFVVRRVTPAGTIETFAGNGRQTGSSASFFGPGVPEGDGGPALAASFTSLAAIDIDANNNVYIADGNKIRRVSPAGIISTFAGTGLGSYSGDGGPATAATLNAPRGVSVDSDGSVLIADSRNNRIRRVAQNGTITTIAGNGQEIGSPPFGDGGPALNALIGNPTAARMIAGSLYIVSGAGLGLRRVGPDGIISTVYGNNIGQGALAADSSGNIYVLDVGVGGFGQGAARIRKILVDPPALQPTPSSLSFSGRSAGPPANMQRFPIVASVPAVPFRTRVETDSGQWLEVDPSGAAETPRILEVTADPGALQPGEHRGRIVIETPQATPRQTTIPVTFSVGQPLPPDLRADKENLLFPFPRAGRRRSQILVVSNNGGGTLPFTVETATVTGGTWLGATPAQGSVTPRTQQALTISADPSRLGTGTYTGAIVLRAGAQTVSIPVTMTISDRDTAVLLSQSGMSFISVASGGVVPNQEFGVLNIGDGVMPWSVVTSTVSGGNWLSVATTSGSTNAANVVPTVGVRINQVGLAPGRYYGLVTVNAPQAANSPQVLTVVLDVLPAGSNPGSVFQPEELTFEFPAGGLSAGSSEALLYNVAGAPLAFRTVTVQRAQHLPRDATVDPQQPTRIVVQPSSFTQPGTYRDNLTMQFSDGTVSTLRLQFNVSAAVAVAAGKSRSADGCTPSRLVPSFISVGQATTAPAGAPSALSLDVKDDCRIPLSTGTVVVSFSNGDEPVVLTPLGDGRWHGTWLNRDSRRSSVVLKAEARDPARNLSGEREVQAGIGTTQERPIVPPNSVVSAASNVSYQPLGPGAMISVYGQNLTDGLTDSASTLPLPAELAGSRVLMNGRFLPLVFAGPGQINAIVHYDLNLNTIHQVAVRQRLGAYSDPVLVAVAPAQPAAFTAAGRAIVVATRGGSSWLVAPNSPARAGDALVIYCSGLGAVDPPLAAGARAPESPLRVTRERPRVFIGGVEAAAAFAGLTPGLAGLYQINATMPVGATRQNEAPLVIEISGQRSVPASIAVE